MKEADIRPQELFNEFLAIAEKDIARFFGDRSVFVEVPCPACESEAFTSGLEKLGFRFVATVDHPEDGKVWEWQLAPRAGTTGS